MKDRLRIKAISLVLTVALIFGILPVNLIRSVNADGGDIRTVSFVVKDNLTFLPVGGADLVINGQNIVTDPSGLAAADLEAGPGIVYDYTVSHPSYHDNVDSISYPDIISGLVRFVYLNPFLSPVINAQPLDAAVTCGQTVTFTIDAQLADTYQWYKGSEADENKVGDNTNTLTLANVNMSDAGDYICKLTNADGSVTSEAATLSVLQIPTNLMLNAVPNSIDYGGSVTLTAELLPPVAGKTIDFTGDYTGSLMTDAAGKVTAILTPDTAKDYSITVNFAGDGIYLARRR